MTDKTIAGLEASILQALQQIARLEKRIESLESVAFSSDWRQKAHERLKASAILME